MRHFRATLVAATILVLLVCGPRYSPAQDSAAQNTPTDEVSEGKVSVKGTVTDVEGKPVRNAKVTISSGQMVKEAISNTKGEFRIKGLGPGPASVIYDARGYNRLEERGVTLVDGVDLSKALQEDIPDSRWSLLLLLPGLVGLSYCAWCDRKNNNESNPGRNQFFIATLGGWVWAGTLFLLVITGGVGTVPKDSLYLFHLTLPMAVYVPALGFVGALLFVLDIRRRYGGEETTRNPNEGGGAEPKPIEAEPKPIEAEPKPIEAEPKPIEDIPKGKEFGMRIFMGPYVAIVVVGLFGKGLTSPEAKGALAFFSGLLVVMFLQWLVEEGQRTLGKLRIESNRRNLDEREWQLEKDMGNLVWAKLRDNRVNTVAELAHLDNRALENLAGGDLPLVKSDLITFRDKARQLVMARL